MSELIMAQANSRRLGGEDKIFSINNQAKALSAQIGVENVANATIGALMDDQGRLVVLSAVERMIHALKPEDFAEYAPIAGLPDYLDATIQAVFSDRPPTVPVGAIATPGGTGAIHNAIQNYTRRGDTILTCDWYWSPYQTIANELERQLTTYPLFDAHNAFNLAGFSEKAAKLLAAQDRLLVIINTPAHNPTGYSLTDQDWDGVLAVLRQGAARPEKKIILLVDVAYIDFASDADHSRNFLGKLEQLPENLLPLIAFSLSKSFTLYGMRTGALLCLSPNQAIIDEFKMAVTYSNRGTWSNGTRAGMIVFSRIYQDPEMLRALLAERQAACALLLARGRAFMDAAAQAKLAVYPYDAGFFAVVPTDDPELVGRQLQQDHIFAVPFGGRGLRVSLASTPERWCRIIPEKMARLILR